MPLYRITRTRITTEEVSATFEAQNEATALRMFFQDIENGRADHWKSIVVDVDYGKMTSIQLLD